MLSYHQQYGIANGIFITYDSQLDGRLLHSKHGEAVRDKAKPMFPHHKFETSTKENFILACVYIMYFNTPTSFRGLVENLREVDLKEVTLFKNSVLQYRENLVRDVDFIREAYGAGVTVQQLLNELSKRKNRFYTMHFFILFHPEIDIKVLKKSRVFGHIIRKLRFTMKFFTFRDESVDYVKSVFKKIEA